MRVRHQRQRRRDRRLQGELTVQHGEKAITELAGTGSCLALVLASMRQLAVVTWTFALIPGIALACTGDCDNTNSVSFQELSVGIDLALGHKQVDQDCPRLDTDSDGQVSVEELVAAVPNAKNGCPPPTMIIATTATPTPTATPSPQPTASPSPTVASPLTVVVESSPTNGEGSVAVRRDLIVRFSARLSAEQDLGDAVHAEFGGKSLHFLHHLSADRRTLTLFSLDEPLPASARIRLTINGNKLRDEQGRFVDADADGMAGGAAVIDFDTLSLTSVARTSVEGRVLASELAANEAGVATETPLSGVKVSVDGIDSLFTFTDAMGRFQLDNVPAGSFFVQIDGHSVQRAVVGGQSVTTGFPDGYYYPLVGKQWSSIAGQKIAACAPDTPRCNGKIYLPLIVPGTLQPVSSTNETRINFPRSVVEQHPELAEVSITVPANSLFGADTSMPGRVGIAPVPPDRLPGPLPPGLEFPLVITVQTSGAESFDTPVPACFPNLPDPATQQVLPPGAASALWSFSHQTGEWEVVGPMTVSSDGRLVCTDPGIGIRAPGWHGTRPGVVGFGGLILAGAKIASCELLKLILTDVALGFRLLPGEAGPDGAYAAKHLERFLWTGGNVHYGPDSSPARDIRAHFEFQHREKFCVEKTLRQRIRQALIDSPLSPSVSEYEQSLGSLSFYPQSSDLPTTQLAAAIGGVCSGARVQVSQIVVRQQGDYFARVRYSLRDQYAFGQAHAALTIYDRAALEIQGCGIAHPFFVTVDVETIVSGNVMRVEDSNVDCGEPPCFLDSGDTLPTTLGAPPTSTIGPINGQLLATAPSGRIVAAPPSAKSVGRYYFKVESSRTGEVIQRGLTGTAGSAHRQLLLSPLEAYRESILATDSLRVGSVTFETGASGSRFELPAILLDTPSGPDSDGDGLIDLAEDIIGTLPGKKDTDGDGIADGVEVQQGTDPLGGFEARTGIIAAAETPGNAVDIVAANDIAVIADSDRGVTLFNVFSGTNPVAIAQVDTAGSAHAVAIAGNLIAVADGREGLVVIDASDPPAARVVRRVSLGGTAQAVATAGRVAYVGLTTGRLAAVDLPTGEILQSVTLPGAVQDVVVGGDVLYALTIGTLHTLPINGEVLRVFTQVDNPGAVGASGRRLRLFAGSDVVYAVHTRGYNTFDLSHPLRPVLITAGTTDQFGWKHLVATGSGTAVAAVGQNSTNDGPHDVSLWNVADPTQINDLITGFETPGIAEAVSIYNGLAYVADGRAGLQVISYQPYDAGGVAPTIELIAPQSAEEGQWLRLEARVDDDVQVRNVEFWIDGEKASTDGSFPFEHRFVSPLRSSRSSFAVRARAVDTGGNATWSDERSIPLVADARPPSVVVKSPANGAIVRTARAVSAVFNEHIDPGSLAGGGLVLLAAGGDGAFGTTDDRSIAGTTAYAPEARTAILELTADLSAGRYRASVAATVRDLAGNALGLATTWEFHVFSSVDADIDGVPDDLEAALGLNPTRRDTNNDGERDGDEDYDSDGLSNAGELLLGTDPTSADSDGDGIRDGSEDSDRDALADGIEARRGTNPFEPDSDNDGYADIDELELSVDPNDASKIPARSARSSLTAYRNAVSDSDSDGVSDADERAVGTDPASSTSRPMIQSHSSLVAYANGAGGNGGNAVSDAGERAAATDGVNATRRSAGAMDNHMQVGEPR